MQTRTIVKTKQEVEDLLRQHYNLSDRAEFEWKVDQDQIVINDPSETQAIDIEISDKLFMDIAELAHQRNVTFNQMCGKLLKQYVNAQNQPKDKGP